MESLEQLGRERNRDETDAFFSILNSFCSCRDGDVPDLTADPSLAEAELGFVASRTLEEACTDLWRWQTNSPQGESRPSSIPCLLLSRSLIIPSLLHHRLRYCPEGLISILCSPLYLFHSPSRMCSPSLPSVPICILAFNPPALSCCAPDTLPTLPPLPPYIILPLSCFTICSRCTPDTSPFCFDFR